MESRDWRGIAAAGVLIAVYGSIGYALLFTPKGYARFVTVFLIVAVLTYIFGVIFWVQYRPPGLPSPLNRALISQVVFGAFFVGLAYVHQLLKNRSRGQSGDEGRAEMK